MDNLSNSPQDSIAPWLVVTKDNVVHVVWAEYDDSVWKIAYVNNSGGVWHAPAYLSKSSVNSTSPRIISDESGRLVAIWRGNESNLSVFYYSVSTDGGEEWSAGEKIPDAFVTSDRFELAVGNGNTIGLVWEDSGNICFASFSDGIWSGITVLDSTGTASKPAIAANPSGGFGVVWRRGSDAEIYYCKPGSGAPVDISNTPGNSDDPDVEFDSVGTAHIVWRDANNTSGVLPGQWDIWYVSYTAEGIMQNKQDISNTYDEGSELPRIAVDVEDRLHVVWGDAAQGNYDIFYAKSEDGGVSWTPWTNIANNTGLSEYAYIMTDGNKRLHVMWEDHTPGDSEIYWNGFNGNSWAGAKNVSNTGSQSLMHRFVLDSKNRVHVVFQDNRSGNYEIYYIMDGGFGATQQLLLKITLSGGCTNENIGTLVQDQNDNRIPNTRVEISRYNITSFLWDDVASLLTNASGEVNYRTELAGYYKFSASKKNYVDATKYLQISECTTPSPEPTPEMTSTPAVEATPVETPAETATPTLTPTPVPTSTLPQGACSTDADCQMGICLAGTCTNLPSTESVMEPLLPGRARLIVGIPADATLGESFEINVTTEYGSPFEGVLIEAFGKRYITNSQGKASITAEQVGAQEITISREGYRSITRTIYITEAGGVKYCSTFVILASLALVAVVAAAFHEN